MYIGDTGNPFTMPRDNNRRINYDMFKVEDKKVTLKIVGDPLTGKYLEVSFEGHKFVLTHITPLIEDRIGFLNSIKATTTSGTDLINYFISQGLVLKEMR